MLVRFLGLCKKGQLRGKKGFVAGFSSSSPLKGQNCSGGFEMLFVQRDWWWCTNEYSHKVMHVSHNDIMHCTRGRVYGTGLGSEWGMLKGQSLLLTVIVALAAMLVIAY